MQREGVERREGFWWKKGLVLCPYRSQVPGAKAWGLGGDSSPSKEARGGDTGAAVDKKRLSLSLQPGGGGAFNGVGSLSSVWGPRGRRA